VGLLHDLQQCKKCSSSTVACFTLKMDISKYCNTSFACNVPKLATKKHMHKLKKVPEKCHSNLEDASTSMSLRWVCALGHNHNEITVLKLIIHKISKQKLYSPSGLACGKPQDDKIVCMNFK